MITEIESPDRVFAMQIEGKTNRADSKNIDQILKHYIDEYGELNLYMELVNFGFSSGEAFWGAVKSDIKLLDESKKIAIAVEEKWMGELGNFLGKITPIRIEIFHLNDRDKAFAWLLS